MSDNNPINPISPIKSAGAAGTVPPKVTPPPFAASPRLDATVRLDPAVFEGGKVAPAPHPTIVRPVIHKPVLGGIKHPAATPTPAPAPTAAKKATSLNSITGPIPAPAILHKTGIIAEGVLTPAQAQAAKTKTSRISLESAIGVAPSSQAPAPLKTIRLRRPTGLPPAPAVANPAPAPAVEPLAAAGAAAPTPAAAPAEPAPSVTQKKTLKLHRPGALSIKRPTIGIKTAAAPAAEGADAAAPAAKEGEVADLKPISAAELAGGAPAAAPAAAAQPSGTVPKWLLSLSVTATIAALLVLGVASYFLVVEGLGPEAGPNDTAFVQAEKDYRPGR